MAGGYKVFGPTYNSTKYVRFGHEGTVNSLHDIDADLVPPSTNAVEELAGKIAMITDCKTTDLNGNEHTDGVVTLCTDPKKAVGLFVDDLGDIVGASGKASFYFRGGEYYISVARMALTEDEIKTLKAGTPLTCAEADADRGKLKVAAEGATTGIVAVTTTDAQMFTTGNMYENAGVDANGGLFVGIALKL